MKASEGRWGPGKRGEEMSVPKIDGPGPASYDIEGSFKKAYEFRGKQPIDKSKRIMFCSQVVKMNCSPGPAKHSATMK